MTVSLNEVEATAKKAARGAGHTWGMAEEAGKATRWLCRHGFDGCAELARLLSDAAGETTRALASDAKPTAPDCPITLGVSISDQAQDLGDDGWRLNAVASPLLLVPFAGDIALMTGQSVALSGPGFRVLTDGTSLNLTGRMPDHAPNVVVQACAKTIAASPVFSRSEPTQKDWTVLQTLAHRTYAPATEASRLKGAGAGTTDND